LNISGKVSLSIASIEPPYLFNMPLPLKKTNSISVQILLGKWSHILDWIGVSWWNPSNWRQSWDRIPSYLRSPIKTAFGWRCRPNTPSWVPGWPLLPLRVSFSMQRPHFTTSHNSYSPTGRPCSVNPGRVSASTSRRFPYLSNNRAPCLCACV